MALTATQQRNAVSEGMALGLLVCGRSVLPPDKIGLELSFAGAWRSWAYKDGFPQVSTDLAKGLDDVRAMTQADIHKRTSVLYWEREGSQFRIFVRDPDWSLNTRR